jgi:hypothetical protein
MADLDDLVGFALAAIGRAEDLVAALVADPDEVPPEGRRDAAIVGLLDDARQLAVLDESAPLAAELELVARVVDRPRAVRLHEDALLDAADELVEALVADLEVDVGHAVDGWSVPARGPGVRDAGDLGAQLGGQAAEAPEENALLDEEFLRGLLAFIVERVGGELLGPRRVEGDVEQV